MSYEEIIIKEYIEQFKQYMKSEKQLIKMLESELVVNEWNENYHIYDPTWINSWKEIISFKELIKEKIEDENKIFKIIKNNLNSRNLFNLKLDNKSIYNIKEGKYLINPMKRFDLISDEVWKIFSKNTNIENCDGKISLLQGNKKIIIRLDDYCYSVRFFTKKNSSNEKYINDYNEFIISFDSKTKEEQEKIINEIAKSNIDDWMKNIGFKFNAKQFPIKKDKISFVIKQKYNNWNFTCIKKYEKTSNISAVMRALSTIEPLTDYFMNNINDIKILIENLDVDKDTKLKEKIPNYEQTTLLNSFKEYILKFWSNEDKKFMPQELCDNIRNLKGKDSFDIKKEQDPINFLRLIIDYLNGILNQKDDNLKFNFNNIKEEILSKLSKNTIDDLDKIIEESNSIIGKLFYGLMLEVYRCENCKKNIDENIKKFDVIDVNYKRIAKMINDNSSNSYTNIIGIDFYIKKDLNIDNNNLSKICNTCNNKAIFKKEILSYPPFLLIRLNTAEIDEKKEEKKEEKKDDNLNKIGYDKSLFMNDFLSDIIKSQRKNNKNIEYELISMVNYTKIIDKTNNKEHEEFINLSKSPFLIEDGIWNSFICNRKPVELSKSYDNDISLPCILFYKLKDE